MYRLATLIYASYVFRYILGGGKLAYSTKHSVKPCKNLKVTMALYDSFRATRPLASDCRLLSITHRFPAAAVQFGSSGIRVASTPLGGPIDCIFVALAYGNDQNDQSAILNFVDEAVADTA